MIGCARRIERMCSGYGEGRKGKKEQVRQLHQKHRTNKLRFVKVVIRDCRPSPFPPISSFARR